MKLSVAIEEYQQSARYELNHAESTYYVYIGRLKSFARWLESQGYGDPSVKDLNYDLLRRYYLHVLGTGIRPRTLRSHVHAQRTLLRYLVDRGVIDENPAMLLKMPKLDAAQRKLVSDSDLEKLLEATTKQGSDFRCVRDRAILSVFVFCALRRQELLDLRIQDINLETRTLLVASGKGKKSRSVPLCKEVHQALTDWVAMRSTKRIRRGVDALFLIPGGRCLGEVALSNLLTEVAAIAGLKEENKIQPHTIRHAAASRLLRNGMSIKGVSTWLGHSDLKTTQIYLHSSEQELVSLADLASLQHQQPQTEVPTRDRSVDRAQYLQSRRRAAR